MLNEMSGNRLHHAVEVATLRYLEARKNGNQQDMIHYAGHVKRLTGLEILKKSKENKSDQKGTGQ
jgi:hypothetical protein